ncbi:MAG: response regulator, partial [Treponema sp.]|nr:response regulator [Treponema sp.]
LIAGDEPLAKVENPAAKAVLCYEKQSLYAESIARTLENLEVPVTLKSDAEEFLGEICRGNYPFAFVSADLAERAEAEISEHSPQTILVLLASAGEMMSFRNMPMITRPAYTVPVANVLNRRMETESHKWKGGHFIAPQARLLVVDDINTNLVVTAGLLAAYQSHVDTCTSGPDAILMVQKENYDIVFMDHMMPEMDGIEATQLIRGLEGEKFKKLPIIALTANAIMGMKEMFLSRGFNDYLSKPIEISKLDIILETWIPAEKQVQNTGQDEAKTEEAVFPKDYAIEGVNIQAGKARYREKTYLEVLRSYCVHTPGLLEKLRNAESCNFSGDTLNEYSVTVHGVKGSTFGICADDIGKQAEALERAAKSGDIPFIKANSGQFIGTVENLIGKLKELLELVSQQGAEKALSPKPDPALLKKLAEACKRYKANVMEEILEQLEACRYESGGDLVAWLREQADNLEYDAIAERLESLE